MDDSFDDDRFDFLDGADPSVRSGPADGRVVLLDDDDGLDDGDDTDSDDDDDGLDDGDDADIDDADDDDDGNDADDSAADDDDDTDDDDDDDTDDDDDDDDQAEFDFEDVLTVAYLYEAVLDRNGEIDLPGLNFWIDARQDGLSEDRLAESFLFSDEFEEGFGDPDDLDDRQLVEICYRNILDREGDDQGVAFWTEALDDDDFDRDDLLLAFAQSVENVEGLDYRQRLVEDDDGEWSLA